MQFLWLHLWKGRYHDFLHILEHPSGPTLVFTPNPEMLLGASRDREFLQTLWRAQYLVPDGNGLYLSSYMKEGHSFLSSGWKLLTSKKWLIKKYGELIKGSDLTNDLVSYAHTHQKKLLLIDNYRIDEPKDEFEKKKMHVQSRILELFLERYRDLSIQVFFLGEMSPDAIAHHIELGHIDYVFGCSGMKSQEKILFEIFSYLPDHLPVVGLGVGSSFDYLLGLQKRAPRLWRKTWLEWLYRLIMNPRKRWSRIIDAVWRFPHMEEDSQEK